MKININGKYPAMANYVLLRHTETGEIVARNVLLDEEIDLTERQARYLLRLNGNRNPKKISGFSYEECVRYYNLFDDMLMLREPGRKERAGLTWMYTLYIPNKLRRTNSVIPKLLNFLLYTSCIPILILGIYHLAHMSGSLGHDFIWLGVGLGLVVGMMLHELSHACACLAYRGFWLELGVMWRIWPGAYVLMDDSRIQKKLQKVQIYLAGIEMNLLLAGLFFLLASSKAVQQSVFGMFTGTMLFAGVQNVALALLNMTFYAGLDGERAISIMMGKKSVVMDAKNNVYLLFDRRERRKFWNAFGVSAGVANLCASAVVLCSQLVLPLLIISDIVVIIGGALGWM